MAGSETSIPTRGVGRVRMAGIPCEFCVVGELQHDILIDTDVMQKCNAVISYEEASITLNG